MFWLIGFFLISLFCQVEILWIFFFKKKKVTITVCDDIKAYSTLLKTKVRVARIEGFKLRNPNNFPQLVAFGEKYNLSSICFTQVKLSIARYRRND